MFRIVRNRHRLTPSAAYATQRMFNSRGTPWNRDISSTDPSTWPKSWNASDIEGFLRGSLLNPAAAPNYKSFETLLSSGDLKSLAQLLKAYVKPPAPSEVDLEQYLARHVNNVVDKASMPAQERLQHLTVLDKALAPKPGSDQRNIAFISSPRGTGKTQFLKWFVFMRRAEAMKYGRVIVRCCDKTSHDTTDRRRPSWITRVLDDRCATATQKQNPSAATDAIAEGLCELIRTHVESVTGDTQDPAKYNNPPNAYAMWMSETARHFKIPANKQNLDPLIILDTCELLAEHDHKSLVHAPSRKPYTLLEAFCLAVPAPYSILVIGCNAQIGQTKETEASLLARANIKNVGPLLPLTEKGYRSAITESWKVDVDDATLVPLHNLTGGVPRLLRLANMNQPQTMSLACGSVNAFNRCFAVYSAAARAQYPVQPAWFPQAYTCFLASSTKAKVNGSGIIPVKPEWRKTAGALTYAEATTLSMGSYDPDKGRFMVAPITFVDAVVTKPDAPILPSQLHPFLNADVVARRSAPSVDSAFEVAFLYAVYARYLLAHWENTSSPSSSPWVSLAKVFEGAIPLKQVPMLERFDVDMSKGLPATAATVMEVGEVHLTCRRNNMKRTSPLIEMPLLLRLQHTHQKAKGTSKQRVASDAPFLLSVIPTTSTDNEGVVFLDADAMSSISWLKSR